MTYDQAVQLRMDSEDVEEIDKIAAEMELKRGELIRLWIREKLEESSPLEKLEKREKFLADKLRQVSERIFILNQEKEFKEIQSKLEKEQKVKITELDIQLSKLKNLSYPEQLAGLKELETKWANEEFLIKKIKAKRSWVEWEMKMKKYS